MHEEIEYAEMLEIPVSTINVVKKSNRRKRQKTTENKPAHHPLATPINEQSFQANPLKDSTPLKDSVIAQVNDKLSDTENLPM